MGQGFRGEPRVFDSRSLIGMLPRAGRGREHDDVPVVTFVAPADGPHPVTVVMSDCRAELCYFGVRVLAR